MSLENDLLQSGFFQLLPSCFQRTAKTNLMEENSNSVHAKKKKKKTACRTTRRRPSPLASQSDGSALCI